MAKTSGNNYARATGGKTIAVTSSGTIISSARAKAVRASSASLDTLPHRDVVKALQSGISRYESVMGVRDRSIRVADLRGAYGVTFLNANGSQGIYLDRKAFSGTKRQIEAAYRKSNYATGYKNLTNRAIKHTITHELAHASWTSSYSAPKYKAAGKEIQYLYKTWRGDQSKKGYGSYGRTNVDEFWAEVITKGIHGSSDKYTRAAIGIAHRFKL